VSFAIIVWAECLLRITSVANVCTVVGNPPSEELAKSLWGGYGAYMKDIDAAVGVGV
jgi:hypothetical protein